MSKAALISYAAIRYQVFLRNIRDGQSTRRRPCNQTRKSASSGSLLSCRHRGESGLAAAGGVIHGQRLQDFHIHGLPVAEVQEFFPPLMCYFSIFLRACLTRCNFSKRSGKCTGYSFNLKNRTYKLSRYFKQYISTYTLYENIFQHSFG